MHISTKKRVRTTELNMTPMIDVVFLLITFFMVVTEITRQDDIADLELPDVEVAMPDDKPDPERLVINIKKDGSVWYSGAQHTDQELLKTLEIEARLSREAGTGVSDRLILVRADARCPFKHIKKLMRFCTMKRIGIWRLAFGIKPREISAHSSP